MHDDVCICRSDLIYCTQKTSHVAPILHVVSSACMLAERPFDLTWAPGMRQDSFRTKRPAEYLALQSPDECILNQAARSCNILDCCNAVRDRWDPARCHNCSWYSVRWKPHDSLVRDWLLQCNFVHAARALVKILTDLLPILQVAALSQNLHSALMCRCMLSAAPRYI